MMMSSFHRTSAALLLLLVLVPLQSAPTALGHAGEGYSHETTLSISNPRWMAALSDQLRVSDLSLPGTHDTMALYGETIVQTQSMNLAEQLRVGIRVFDIRCRTEKNRGLALDREYTVGDDSFSIYHGLIFQFAHFGPDVLGPAIDFLRENPSEAIFMKVVNSGVRDPEPGTGSFEETFNGYWQANPDAFWTDTAVDNPRLVDLRGKIVIVQRKNRGLKGELADFGLEVEHFESYPPGNSVPFRSKADLYGRWEEIRAHLHRADGADLGTVYSNSLVGSGAAPSVDNPVPAIIFPWWVASGHMTALTASPRERTPFRDSQQVPRGGRRYPDFPRVDCELGSACVEGCETAGEGCRSVCTRTANACRTPCRTLGDACRALCPPGVRGKACRDRCNQKQADCEKPCNDVEASCKAGCRTTQEACEEPCGLLEGCAIAYEGTNELTSSYIRLNVNRRVGMIFMDFPGPGLINAVIDLNSRVPIPPPPCSDHEPGDEDCSVSFRRGDSNGDGAVDVSDAVTTLRALFFADTEFTCRDAVDTNDDGRVDIADAVVTLGILFAGHGSVPPPGTKDCGVDPTDDELDCERHDACP